MYAHRASDCSLPIIAAYLRIAAYLCQAPIAFSSTIAGIKLVKGFRRFLSASRRFLVVLHPRAYLRRQ